MSRCSFAFGFLQHDFLWYFSTLTRLAWLSPPACNDACCNLPTRSTAAMLVQIILAWSRTGQAPQLVFSPWWSADQHSCSWPSWQEFVLAFSCYNLLCVVFFYSHALVALEGNRHDSFRQNWQACRTHRCNPSHVERGCRYCGIVAEEKWFLRLVRMPGLFCFLWSKHSKNKRYKPTTYFWILSKYLQISGLALKRTYGRSLCFPFAT